MSEVLDIAKIEVPTVDPLYFPMGNADDYRDILKAHTFLPFYISGPSGTGKTYSLLQEAAKLGREVLRVNMTGETDESDLIGSFRLLNGETVYSEGPIIQAMRRGCVLLLDEVDLANPARIMCLQSILEGSPYFNKKTKEMIYPADGFTIVATANTKGRGDDRAKFISANVHNEAFLERFAITFDQDYTDEETEKKLLSKLAEALGLNLSADQEYVDALVDWANEIRKQYMDANLDDVISTRRLVHILRTYSVFHDRDKAINYCINRFDSEIKDAFLHLWNLKKPGAPDIQENRIEDKEVFDLDNGEDPFDWLANKKAP